MIYYILPYIFSICLGYFISSTRLKFRNYGFLLFSIIFPATIIAVFRGNVGTDTGNYLFFFRELIDTGDSAQFEIGFRIFSKILAFFLRNERACVAVVSFITILLLCSFFGKSKIRVLFFTFFVFPIFFYDMTMNGLRYGLAFSLSGLAVNHLVNNKLFKFITFSLLAIVTQVSSAIIILSFFFSELKLKNILLFGGGILACFLLMMFFSVVDLSYLYDKQDFYKDLTSPNSTSGLSTLVIFFMLFFAFLICSEGKSSKYNNIIYAIFVGEILSFLLAKVSYSGLRFQSVFLYTLSLYVCIHLDRIVKTKFFWMIIFCAGFLGFLITVKNLRYIDDETITPFLPYKFFWNEQ